jgi:F-type H+-transporting ATPase subunit delta
MEEIARVYADALFGVAKEKDKLDDIHDELGQFADAMESSHDMQTFFFSPYFTSNEKRDAIAKSVSGADEEFVNFLELLTEKHRMPVIFAIRRAFDELWAEERKRLDVTVTSAVELDPKVVQKVGDEIQKQTGREIDLNAVVDQDVLGGLVLRVGNRVLDASVRAKLERLRREIATAGVG